MRRLFVRIAALTTAAAALAGCATDTSMVTDAFKFNFGAPAADSAKLNPDLVYMRVTNGKSVALMVLGYVDAAPEAGTEVWYSAAKEKINLWRGRVAGTAGLSTDWRAVQFADVPTWKSALSSPASYRRQRDVMPGYAVGVREQVLIRAVPAPASSRLVGMRPDALQWFEETAAPEGRAPTVPAARYAVDLSGAQERVVYSEQCLTPTLCLTFQAWPAPAGASRS